MMKTEGYTNFSIHGSGGFVDFWQSVDGKNPSKQLGVEIANIWFWYERMVDQVREELINRCNE